MGKGSRNNLERLLRSAWEYQLRQEVLSISPKLQMVDSIKAEKSLVRRFFANAFVQAVAVFIALAVAFSGKLDAHGTSVAILLAWGIGFVGIWTHCSNNRNQQIIACLLIMVFSSVLWAFYNYLTGKSPTTPVIAIPATPARKPIIRGYGDPTLQNCRATLDASSVIQFRDTYDIALVCGINDPKVDKFEDDRITTTPLFTIRLGDIPINIPFSKVMSDGIEEMREAAISTLPPSQKTPGSIIGVPISFWMEIVLLPKGTNTASIRKLNDVPIYHGRILSQEQN